MTNILSDLRRLTEAVHAAGADIAPTYREYVQLAFAIATDCGEAGRSDFLMLCSLSAKYDVHAANKLFSNALKTNNNSVHIGTAFHLAELCNVRPRPAEKPLTVRVVTLVSSRLVTVWVTTQKCASLNSLTTTKTWLRKKWLRKLPVPVVQRRALLPKLLPLLKLHRLPKLLLLKKQKQNNSTILFIYRKPSQRLGRLFCLRFYHFYGKH